MLATGSLLAAALLPLRLLVLIALTATDAAGTLEKKISLELLLCPQRHGPAGRGNTMGPEGRTEPCRTGKHHGPEGRTESKICVSRGRNVPSEISYKKLAIRLRFTFFHTFLNAGYWLAASCCTAAVALTATDAAGTLEKKSITAAAAAAAAGAADPSKGGFRQGNPMLLSRCCCAHKGTALPDGENTMALKDERSPKYAFPEAGTSLLKSPTNSKLIGFSRLAAGSLLAAALLPLRLLLLRLLVSAAAY